MKEHRRREEQALTACEEGHAKRNPRERGEGRMPMSGGAVARRGGKVKPLSLNKNVAFTVAKKKRQLTSGQPSECDRKAKVDKKNYPGGKQ